MATMNNAIMLLNFFEVVNWFEEEPDEGYKNDYVGNGE